MKDILRAFRSDKDKVCTPNDASPTPLADPLTARDSLPILSSSTYIPPTEYTQLPAYTQPRVEDEGAKPLLTVVELFQSQGCSSCPPANDNVIQLAEDPNKLVLTYEVTYWDYLGWPDTFGSKSWDSRQRDYAAAFKSRSVYTPQVIVNGLSNGVGSRQSELQNLVRDGEASPHASTVTVTILNGQVMISGPDDVRGIVQLVLYDPGTHNIVIARGENRGRNLPHRNIVRDLLVLGWWEGGNTEFPLPILEENGLRAAILVQRGRGGPIVGACKV
ncbi:hypothetical protein PHLGIDRAFT_182804 [Phlebiopsis gigantea 11061_1 CR5-6]|uniref:DUF1223-domain-containing protein n=1 Tax=Phlebiopsis gigantea (strain 11061_1 CR5-6) TaxID=745531 RepID=A0A0C3PG69_PHLG1|nr:hypothetical protein PHLGIDRAFT_182804 [Phlebiopsis gigantea 11061_1 CR5-6]